MTVIDTEPPIPNNHTEIQDPRTLELSAGAGIVEVSFGTSNPKMLQESLALREDFVVRAKWFEPGHKEWDMYDDNESTLHLAGRKEVNSPLEVGMRLTPVRSSVGESLTWSMLNQDMAQQVNETQMDNGISAVNYLNNLAINGNLYDLTRLVSGKITSMDDINYIKSSMMELFGVAAGAIRKEKMNDTEQLKDVRWLFATTDSMWSVLNDDLGVQMKVIAEGQVSEGDDFKTLLCLVEQEDAIDYIYEHPDDCAYSLQYLDNGLRKANAL